MKTRILTIVILCSAVLTAATQTTHAQEPPPVLVGSDLELRVQALEEANVELQDEVAALEDAVAALQNP